MAGESVIRQDDLQAMREAQMLLEGIGKQYGIVERNLARAKNMFYATRIGGLIPQIKGFNELTKATTKQYKSVEEQEKAIESLTWAQWALHKVFLQHTVAVKRANDKYRELEATIDDSHTANKRFRLGLFRLTTNLALFTTIIIAVIGSLALLSLGVSGTASPVLELTEGIWGLHTALEGIVYILKGEGEGGALSLFAGSLLLGTFTALVFGKTIGALVFILSMSAGAFRKTEDATNNTTLAWIAATATGFTLFNLLFRTVATLRFLGRQILNVSRFTRARLIPAFRALGQRSLAAVRAMARGFARFFGRMFAHMARFLATYGGVLTRVLGGLGLVVAGFYGLYLFATGKINGIKGLVIGVISAVAVAIGILVLLGSSIAALPVLIIAGVLFAIAAIYRYRDELYNFFAGLPAAIVNVGTTMYTSLTNDFWNAMSALMDMWDMLVQYIADKMPDLSPITDTLGSIGGAISSAGSRLTGRAIGGPVVGGQPYIVGEKGPEVFTPQSSGSIIPNHSLGSNQTITMNIDVSGVTDRTDKRALAREISDMLSQELRRQGGNTTRSRF